MIFSTVQQFFYRRADRMRARCQHFQTPARQAQERRSRKRQEPRFTDGGSEPIAFRRDPEMTIENRNNEGVDKNFREKRGSGHDRICQHE